jgi:hypothetical protein
MLIPNIDPDPPSVGDPPENRAKRPLHPMWPPRNPLNCEPNHRTPALSDQGQQRGCIMRHAGGRDDFAANFGSADESAVRCPSSRRGTAQRGGFAENPPSGNARYRNSATTHPGITDTNTETFQDTNCHCPSGDPVAKFAVPYGGPAMLELTCPALHSSALHSSALHSPAMEWSYP